MKRGRLVVSCSIAVFALAISQSHLRAADVPVHRDDHMEMTLPAAPAPGDAARGTAILTTARSVMSKYADVAAAERDGYVKFLPNIPLPHEHYTNNANAIAASFGTFDPAAPTSIIYTRTPSGLVIAGVMYTAPNRFDAAQLDARVPLSLGTWHRHIDFCRPPAGIKNDPRFGFTGTIHTRAACDAAGGRFTPRIFAWMVHVWPNETDPAKIWAVDADGAMEHHHHADGMLADQTALPISRDKIPVANVALGDATHGADVFTKTCAGCHGTGGANGPDAPRLRDSGLSAGQVAYFVRNPQALDRTSAMPKLALDDRDLADVAAYVASLSKRAP